MEDYRTIRGTAIGEYEEKKSRFIAQLSFADSEEAAVAFLEKVRAENRTARLLFKLAVEVDMMMHLFATAMEIEPELLEKLRALCVREIKKTNGSISLKDVVEYQRGGDQ